MIPGWSIARYVSFDHFVSAGEQVDEMTTPGAFAVLRLKVSSSFAGISTGTEAGSAPFGILAFRGSYAGRFFVAPPAWDFRASVSPSGVFGVYDPMSLDP